MELVPITFKTACEFITKWHRHHRPPQGMKFTIGLSRDSDLVGVIVVGRPVARLLDNGFTAEVTRCCVQPEVINGCSMLYAAAWRAARAMGYIRLITYTLNTEPGSSVRAAGYKLIGECKPGGWNRPSRHRADLQPTCTKNLYEIELERS